MTHENELQNKNKKFRVVFVRCSMSARTVEAIKTDTVCIRLVPVPTLLPSSGSPSLDPAMLLPAMLLPAMLPQLLSILAEPPTSKLPRVRRERRGGGAPTKPAKRPRTHCTSGPAAMYGGYAADGEDGKG